MEGYLDAYVGGWGIAEKDQARSKPMSGRG
jgi:hypothetical protein